MLLTEKDVTTLKGGGFVRHGDARLSYTNGTFIMTDSSSVCRLNGENTDLNRLNDQWLAFCRQARTADRLWLAGMAMQAMIIKGAGGSTADAFLMADEMLKELDK